MNHTPDDCPYTTNEKEMGAVQADVATLKNDTQNLYKFLREHMDAEIARFDEMNRQLVESFKERDKQITELRMLMAKMLGGGMALMIASDWIMRSGVLFP